MAVNYPADIEIDYPEHSSRGWAALLIFTFTYGKALALLPHFFILWFLGFGSSVVFVISQFAVLFTGKYPASLFDFVAGTIGWSLRVIAFFLGLSDDYPPFALHANADYPVQCHVERPATSSRIWAFNTISIGITLMALSVYYLGSVDVNTTNASLFNVRVWALLPHGFVLVFLGSAAVFVFLIAVPAVLFSGRFPEGMHTFLTGLLRWSWRLSVFTYGLSDKYPPFTLDANDERFRPVLPTQPLGGLTPPPPPPPPPSPSTTFAAPPSAATQPPATPPSPPSPFEGGYSGEAPSEFVPDVPAAPPAWQGWDAEAEAEEHTPMPEQAGEWGLPPAEADESEPDQQ